MRNLGVADYPDKELLENLWRSGLRAKAILQYLDENNLPSLSANALARYGQRNWTEAEDEYPEECSNESVLTVEDLVSDIKNSNLGNVERVSISKTGYSISIKPQLDRDLSALEDLPRMAPEVPRTPPEPSEDDLGPSTHLIIPDTQSEPGRPSEHLNWLTQWTEDEIRSDNLKVIHLGDHWNMGSLSSYDKGKGSMEGRRYLADIEEGNATFAKLQFPSASEKHFLLGNHEYRVNKAVESDIQLEGLLTTDHMLTPGWERHGFLNPVFIDGVGYSHYWYHPNTGKPYGGVVSTRLKTIGHSFVMGHQQGLDWAQRYVAGQQQFGLVAGSYYLHEEDYKGPQGNRHWQGVIVLHDVKDGSCESPEFVSLERLRRKYG